MTVTSICWRYLRYVYLIHNEDTRTELAHMRPKCTEQVVASVFHLVQKLQYTKLRAGREAPWINPPEKHLGHFLFPYSVQCSSHKRARALSLSLSLSTLQVTNRRNSIKDFRTFLGSSKCPADTQIPGCIACFSCNPPKIKISAQTLFSKYKIHWTSDFSAKVRFHSAAAQPQHSPFLITLPSSLAKALLSSQPNITRRMSGRCLGTFTAELGLKVGEVPSNTTVVK